MILSKLNQNKKNISYLSTNFDKIKQSLIDYSKYYFPNSYKDFSDGSVGMMFTEQVAYVGDVMSFYIDTKLQESMVSYANERKNLINHAISNGYKIKVSSPSQVLLDVYQIIPSKTDDFGEQVPDFATVQNIKEGMTCQTSDGISFISKEPIYFHINSPESPMEYEVFARDQNGIPQSFLLKKTVPAFSAERKTVSFEITDPEPFRKIILDETDVISIEAIIDSEKNKWYEVNYLAQENIPIAQNVDFLFSNEHSKNSTVSKLLKYIKTSNKFIVYVGEDNRTIIQFGDGNDSGFVESVENSPTRQQTSLSRFGSNSYGKSPKNTTLYITYLRGGGINSNVISNSINTITGVEYEIDLLDLTPALSDLYREIRQSVRVTNPQPSTGGSEGDTNEEIRQNILLKKHSQNRIVNQGDYENVLYSMPAIYGKIEKAFSKRDPFSLGTTNIFILSSDNFGKLTKPNGILIKNIKEYINNYRILSENIQILAGDIINVGVDYKIKILSGYSKRDVSDSVNSKIKEFFDIKNQWFFQPIDLSQLQIAIGQIEGVQTVSEIRIFNLNITHGDYSESEYNIEYATRDNVIYPSLDPSIFEIKYPSVDIKGVII